MKKRMQKIALLMCNAVLVSDLAGAGMITGSAATGYTNSIGSESTDKSIGKDTVQGKMTEYGDTTQADGDHNESVNVYATRQSEYEAVIPKTVILDAATRTGEYAVNVKGDIAGDEYVFVKPDDTVLLKQNGKSDVTGAITQQVQKFYDDTSNVTVGTDGVKISETVPGAAGGKIEADDLTAGSWNGVFNFQIGIDNDSESGSGNETTNKNKLVIKDGDTVISDGDTVAMGTNSQVQLSSTIDGQDASGEVEWESDNDKITVTDGLIRTSASAGVGETANITVTTGLGTADAKSTDAGTSVTFAVKVVDITFSDDTNSLTSLELAPGSDKTIDGTIIPGTVQGTIKFTTTAMSGLDIENKGNNQIVLHVASDMPLGKEYNLVASYGNFSKLLPVKIVADHATITYTDADGNTVTKEGNGIDGTITLPNLEKDGYEFLGWVENDGDTPVKDLTVGINDGDKVFKPVFKENTATITYQDADGNIVTKTLDSSEKTFTLPNLSKEYYDFLGWKKDGDETVKKDVVVSVSNGNTTYVPVWKEHTATITYQDIDGNTVTKALNASAPEFVLPSYSKSYYTFNGWIKKGETNAVTNVTCNVEDGDAEYTASWTEQTTTITYTDANGKTVTKTLSPSETSITLPNDLTKDGYEFLGWVENDTDEPQKDVTVSIADGNKAYKPAWKTTVTYELADGTTATHDLTTADPTFTLPTQSKTGYTFLGYVIEDTDEPQTDVTVNLNDGPQTYKAVWKQDSVTITYEDADGNKVTKELTADDSTFTLPKLTKDGYLFLGWKKDGSDTTEKNVTCNFEDGDAVYVAEWDDLSEYTSFTLNTSNRSTVPELSDEEIEANDYNVVIPATFTATDGTKYKITEITGDINDYGTSIFGENIELKIKSVTIPESVTSIGDCAFKNCYSMTSVTLPEGVISIGSRAFYDGQNMVSVNIPKSVTSIKNYAFVYCYNLTTVNFSGTTTEWNAITKGSNIFKSTNVTTVHCTDGDVTL